MAFGGVTFQPLSFQQANPVGAGMMQGAQIGSTILQSQMQRLQSQALQQKMPYVGPQAAAQVGLTGAQANEANSLGGLYQANANLTNQLTPYKVQNARATVYPDPILQRAQQVSMITGKPVNQVLSEMGLTGGGQQPTQMPAPQQYQQQPAPQQQNPNQQWQGVPFLTPEQQQIRMMQQAQSYPVIPGNVPNLRQVQQMPGMQITSQNAPQLFEGNQQQPQQLQQPQQMQQPQQLQAPQGYGNAGQQLTPTSAPKMFGGDPMQNFMMFGAPYNPIQYEALKKGATQEASTSVDAWNKAQADAATGAQEANDMRAQLQRFQDAYKRSYYKGGLFGDIPTTGVLSAPFAGWKNIRTGQDLSQEQLANNAAQALGGYASHQMFPGQRITNNEFAAAAKTKPSLAMYDEGVNSASGFFNSQIARQNEYQQFMNAARQQGVTSPQTAQAIFQIYNQQRPYFDAASGKPFANSSGAWRDYLTPQMISAVQNGQQIPVLEPPHANKAARDSWFKALQPADQNMFISQLQVAGGK